MDMLVGSRVHGNLPFTRNSRIRLILTMNQLQRRKTKKQKKKALLGFSTSKPDDINSSEPAVTTQGSEYEVARFKVTSSCTLVLLRGDITKWYVNGKTDAIVNAANKLMLGGAGVDGAIHRAAGPELLAACKRLPEIYPNVRCVTGSAVQTPAFRLPVSRIIHTVGPIFDIEESHKCSEDLFNAYSNTLKLARGKEIEYIAFPAISCGIYGYPLAEAAQIAFRAVKDQSDGFKEIYLILFEDSVWRAFLANANKNFEKME